MEQAGPGKWLAKWLRVETKSSMIPRFVTMVTFMKMEHTIRGAGLRERDVWF